MRNERQESDRGPSLTGQLATWLRRLSGGLDPPASYAPALTVLAAIPGATALLAGGLALVESHRTALLLHAKAGRIASIGIAHHDAAMRAAMAPYIATPTLTAQLVEVAALLPPEATLHSIARGADGIVRIEVDCPDPDALLRAFPSPRWRSVAQSVTAGTGVRVTLKAAR